ncbi:nicotinate-nucleotide adenylyltransferase [soil metagenome]
MAKASDKIRIGIYAGTFDPVHDGHLSFAREAARQNSLDKVFFMVEPKPRRKQGVKALVHRQYMIHRSIVDEYKFGNIMLEQERFSVVETMPILQARFKGARLYMLMADDVLTHLSGWPHLEELLESVHFIVGLRHSTTQEVQEQAATLEKITRLSFNYTIIKAPLSSISSRRIRSVIKSGKQPKGVPAPVLDYIKEQNLYKPL